MTGFVTNRDAEVLLVRDRRRGWEMPGDQVEEGEDLVSALQREIEEEAGCTVEVTSLVGAYSRLSAPALVVLLFRCAYVAGEARSRDEDVEEAAWFTSSDARRVVWHPVILGRLEDALAARDDVVYRTYRHDPYVVVAERTI